MKIVMYLVFFQKDNHQCVVPFVTPKDTMITFDVPCITPKVTMSVATFGAKTLSIIPRTVRTHPTPAVQRPPNWFPNTLAPNAANAEQNA